MFDFIGEKIKKLAMVVTWVGIAGSVISGIVMMAGGAVAAGIGAAIGGSLAAWLGSFVLYGFGELIEQTTLVAKNTKELLGRAELPASSSAGSAAVKKAAPAYVPAPPARKTWICKSCKTQNDVGKLFCKNCGEIVQN